MLGIGLYVYTMCTHNDSNPYARTWALSSFSLSLSGEREEAGALSMLALKVLTVSESREGFSKLSFADALYDTVPRK